MRSWHSSARFPVTDTGAAGPLGPFLVADSGGDVTDCYIRPTTRCCGWGLPGSGGLELTSRGQNVSEFEYRYNTRGLDDGGMSHSVLDLQERRLQV